MAKKMMVETKLGGGIADRPAAMEETPQMEMNPAESRIAESRKALGQPLAAGQAFFEAPDGFVVVAEADRPHVLYRQGNEGKGMWINPRR